MRPTISWLTIINQKHHRLQIVSAWIPRLTRSNGRQVFASPSSPVLIYCVLYPSRPTSSVADFFRKHFGRQLCTALLCIRLCRGITEVMEMTLAGCEVLRRFYTSGGTNVVQLFELIYPYFSLRLFIFWYRFIPRWNTSASSCINIRGYHHRSKKLKDRTRSKSLKVQSFSWHYRSQHINPKAFLSTFQCTPSTRSHRSEPELNSNSTGLDLSASGIVRKTFWPLLSQVVSWIHTLQVFGSTLYKYNLSAVQT